MIIKKQTIPIFKALAISFLSFVILFFAILYIACIISPSIFIDPETGNEHGVMIIGQTITSLVVAAVISIIIFILSFKYFRKTAVDKANR